MNPIDRKFIITAVNPCKPDMTYTEMHGVYFCAHDEAVPDAIREYRRKCEELGSSPEHLESIDLMLDRILDYQLNINSKVPDTETDCEIDRCIGGLFD